MNLKHLTDKVLIEDTKVLVSKEREVLVQLLHHIKEIDSRKLYSDLGYSSLFAYLTKGLEFSESPACRRISAARLLKSHPEIENKSSIEVKKEIYKELGKLPDQKVSIKVNSQNTYELKITIDEETNELVRELKGLSKGDLNSFLKDALKTQIELKKKNSH
jgi:hypothetical protein